jgi:hypothetical protein
MSNKVSAPSTTVTATTLAQDLHPFPFSHSLIDSALREPLLQYQLSLEWTSHSLRSGTALMYLTTAALYDPAYKGSDGTMIKDRILAHIRNMLVPGSKREPGASGSLDTSSTSLAIQALDLASTIPAVWGQLTPEEKDKITLIMQAHLVAAHWGHDDDNNFSTGIDQLGNFNKGWNPNYVEGAIASALATVRYLGGADKANAFLLSYDYDSFMSKLQTAGLSSIAWTFRQTGKTALEAAVKNEFTFRGHTLDQPFEWMKDRALIMYNKTVKAQLYSNDTLRAFVNNPEGLPNVGMMGMAQEFDSVDANGIRSDLDYVTRGWNNSILSLLESYYYGLTVSADPADVALIQSRYEIGSTDMIYKAVNGYSGYAKGKSLGFRDEFTADANVGYYWLKELWENVISQPSLIPVRDAEPVPAVLAVAKPGTIVLSDDNGQDTGLLDGNYKITMNMWYGDNGTLYKLYENDVLVDTQVLSDKSPNAQSTATSIANKPNGTYKYYAELTNTFGTSKSREFTVTVQHAAPAKPVLANNNWDGDGNFNVNMNMWWGTNGTTYNLYENSVLIYSQALTVNTPNAQSAVANLTGKEIGTYEYRGELVNYAGTTSSTTMIVKVTKH